MTENSPATAAAAGGVCSMNEPGQQLEQRVPAGCVPIVLVELEPSGQAVVRPQVQRKELLNIHPLIHRSLRFLSVMSSW